MSAFRFITAQFGFAYLGSATAALAFLSWLALGPYGHVHLGPEGSTGLGVLSRDSLSPAGNRMLDSMRPAFGPINTR